MFIAIVASTTPSPEHSMVTREVQVVAVVQKVGLVIAKGRTRAGESEQLIHELRHILQQVSEVLLAEQKCDFARHERQDDFPERLIRWRGELVDHMDCFDESRDSVDVDGLAKALRGHVAERFDVVFVRDGVEADGESGF
ncbi:hypothetical protein KC361_g152 [Hortaea werneckii]|nr:hypothetical protein KC361_g152 [Hortaea werneckii]